MLRSPGPDHVRKLKGVKMRDEFLCPITHELMREPVIAMDGHTYEKQALDKWFKTNSKSPMTGQAIETTTIPNICMHRLIQDLINEGGTGLYVADAAEGGRLLEVCHEKVLLLKCQGPPESEWDQQTFSVTSLGCIGGRRQQKEDEEDPRDMMIFKDLAVSRKHFEILHMGTGKLSQRKFCIRDLGSAGGTFIRIPHGVRKELHTGMLLLLGKHQFTVSSIDEARNDQNNADSKKKIDQFGGSSSSSAYISNSSKLCQYEGIATETEMEMSALVTDAEQLLDQLEASSSAMSTSAGLKKRLNDLSKRISAQKAAATGGSKNAKPLNDYKITDSEEADRLDQRPKSTLPSNSSKRLTLTCFSPDGSPFQGRSFIIGSQGATLGRRVTSDIALCIAAPKEGGSGRANNGGGLAQPGADSDGEGVIGSTVWLNLDTAISSDHAKIFMDPENGQFYIMDGTATKPSTNGTWLRLSGPHQESSLYPLADGGEILIGTSRFRTKEHITISEKFVDAASHSKGEFKSPN